MLNHHFLLTLTAVFVQCVEESDERPRASVRLVEIVVPHFNRLRVSRPAIALHCCQVRSHDLRGDHSLKLTNRLDACECGNRSGSPMRFLYIAALPTLVFLWLSAYLTRGC
jgi:hypothetical protein